MGSELFEHRVAAQQLWISSRGIAQEQREALSPGNESVVQEQRFSDELKTGVKTKDKRRSGGGHCGYPSGSGTKPTPLKQRMDYYVALRGTNPGRTREGNV